jgi:NTP pyrophosphatase (non-canonical NTP hydrolase)
MSSLTFNHLRVSNSKRGAEWDRKPAALDDLSFRAMELGGEAGEALNVAKKLVRHLSGRVGGLTLEQARPMLAEELADVVICADRVAEVLGIDLGVALVAKFNKTSAKHGLRTMDETDDDIATLRDENEHLHDLLAAFEWQRINSLSAAEVEKELLAEGYSKERLDAGMQKLRATLASKGIDFTPAELAADHATQLAEDKRDVEIEQLRSADAAMTRRDD